MSGRDYLAMFNFPPLPFLSSEGEDVEEEEVARLPLFSRCPITNEARLEKPELGHSALKVRGRLPLVPISNLSLYDRQEDNTTANSHNLLSRFSSSNTMFSKSCAPDRFDIGYGASASYKPSRLMPPKPSLDDIQDTSIVALTNKFGKGKYWFKSACPMPDPRWGAAHQLMIGPIPGDVEYSQLRAAFLSQGHTLHLFIQNNQAWLEKNQEKFGDKHVKFGYVVYTDREVAARLLRTGYVAVGRAKVGVKPMDGRPAAFNY